MSIVSPPAARSLLALEQITKRYPGVQALRGVTLDIQPGEVHALVGENGAGKSTLIRILAGAERPDSGRLYWQGRPLAARSPAEALRSGISVIYQEFNLVPDLSAAENVVLGRQPTRHGHIDFAARAAVARRHLAAVGAEFDPATPVRQLSVAGQQLVEIAKALAADARLLAMDEPTAALGEHEVTALLELVRGLRARGVGVLYISHRLEEVAAVADRVTVLRDGEVVSTTPAAELDREEIVRRMIGRAPSGLFPPPSTAPGAVVLQVRGLTGAAVREVSFDLRAGEVLGLAGLVGAGRTELARLLFGADRRTAGTVCLDGRPLRLRHPADAVAAGIGLLTEDRKQQGLVLDLPVRHNVTLANLAAVSAGGVLRPRREAAVAAGYVQALGIRTPSVEQVARHLSGGNQQKVVLARWLFAAARVVIFDEPTRGIDLGAQAEIHQLIRCLTAEGKSVILISSVLEEVLGLSDRVLVMRAGAVAGELARPELTAEAVMRLALGE